MLVWGETDGAYSTTELWFLGFGIGYPMGKSTERKECPNYRAAVRSEAKCQSLIADNEKSILDSIFANSSIRDCAEGSLLHDGDILMVCSELVDAANDAGQDKMDRY